MEEIRMSEKINENVLKVTTIDELIGYSKGQIVELPAFAEGQPFVARLIRPSLLDMVADGTIPNPLISTANKLFMSGVSSIDEKSEVDMKNFITLMDNICKRALVEPSYDLLVDNGIKLTDEQRAAIMNYVQHGVKALDSFRLKR